MRSPAGSAGPFDTLAPRQAVTSTPQAVRALSVPWSGVQGVPANVANAFSPWQLTNGSSGPAIRYVNGSVGIGNLLSSLVGQTLEVRGFNDSGIRLTGGLSSIRNALGGELLVNPGNGRDGGAVTISGGAGSGSDPSQGGSGGAVNITGGTGAGSTSTGGIGGSVVIAGGNPDFSAFGNLATPGHVFLSGGSGGSFTTDGCVYLQHRATTSIFGQVRNHFPIRVTNTTQSQFVGGMRLSDEGFFDFTNNAATNPTSGFARLSSTGAWSQVSDARLKTDIAPADGLLDQALALRPVRYHYKDRATGPLELGFIAQDVQRVIPEAVVTGDILTLDYARLSTVAIGAVRELEARHRAEMAKRDAELVKRDAELADLRARLERLEAARSSGHQ